MSLSKVNMIPSRQGKRLGREALATAVERGILAPMMWGKKDTRGTSKPIGQVEWLDQDGNESVTTDGGGIATITYPKAFPKGTLRVSFSSTAATYTKLSPVTAPTASAFTIVGPVGATFTVEWSARGY